MSVIIRGLHTTANLALENSMSMHSLRIII